APSLKDRYADEGGNLMPYERDPVCGARVHTSSAAAREQYGGQVYVFCSHACHERFRANPEQFAWKKTGPE
ncbi:MAG: YHS domain-containing protein, partial [Dehalococcoidia bacterium]